MPHSGRRWEGRDKFLIEFFQDGLSFYPIYLVESIDKELIEIHTAWIEIPIDRRRKETETVLKMTAWLTCSSQNIVDMSDTQPYPLILLRSCEIVIDRENRTMWNCFRVIYINRLSLKQKSEL